MRTRPPSHPPHTDIWSAFGLPNYDQLLDKANLATRIDEAIHRRQLYTANAAAQLGIAKPALCALLHSEFHAYTTHTTHTTHTLRSFLDRLEHGNPLPPEKSRADES